MIEINISCFGIVPDGSKCPRVRKRGEYCISCWNNGWRKPCSGYNLRTGVKCKLKAKVGNYCGNHKHMINMKLCIWKINDGRNDENVCSRMQIKGEYCKVHFECIENRKRKNKLEKNKNMFKLKIYTKEDYDIKKNIINKNKILKDETLLYRQNIITGNNGNNNKKYDNLIIIKNIELIDEWSFSENIKIGLDIKKLTCGSGKKAWWKCSKLDHPSYFATIHLRTGGGSKCKECNLESRGRSKEQRTIEKKVVEERKIDPKYNTTETGDNTESYIVDLLSNSEMYKNVQKIGNIAGKADIKITMNNGDLKYIQVKTLSCVKNKDDLYYFPTKKYRDNMLIVGVNKNRDRFMVEFYKRFKNIKTLSLPFNSIRSKYNDIMYKDSKLFTDKMIELIPLSCSTNIVDPTSTKEISSLDRLEQFCINNGLDFNRNTTNGNSVDCYINNYKMQAKYRSENHGYNFKIDIKKSSGMVGGKRTRYPYQENDFDYLIVEVGGMKGNIGEYFGNFCIIPMSILINKGLIRTKDCDGKKTVNICPPDTISDHWTKKYWNNYQSLKR